jgi:radical SAM protein (TIGR04043 family)/putative N-acetyltransferase (TIGR04045 family)
MSDTGHIIAEVQSLGIRVEQEMLSRAGGAGPAEGGALILDGFPVNAPIQSPFALESPYSLERKNGSARLCRKGRQLISAQVTGRPKFYSRSTDRGVPYHHIALLHGSDCLASTVLQTCVYWDTPKRCAFCGIELSLEAGQTIARKSPSQLAEVAAAARDLDGVSHVVLTTGTGAPPGSEINHLAACTRTIKEASGLPVHVQFMPPPDLNEMQKLKEAGVDTVGIHIESFDQGVLSRLAPPKAALGIDAFRAAWRHAVELFGPNQVSSFLIAGLGESPESIIEGCRFMADMGVYPFLVPHRPIPGSQLADQLPPAPEIMNRMYADLALILESRGLSAKKSKAGCVRCGACSAAAAWEKTSAELICLPARTQAEEQAAFTIRRKVFVKEQRLFPASDIDDNDPRSIHLVAVRDDEVVGTVRVYPVQDSPGHWIGGRLAVIRRERASGAGELLVQEAMRTVKRLDCARFTATIQERNVIWFEKLGWRREGGLFDLLGKPHQIMQADLNLV